MPDFKNDPRNYFATKPDVYEYILETLSFDRLTDCDEVHNVAAIADECFVFTARDGRVGWYMNVTDDEFWESAADNER